MQRLLIFLPSAVGLGSLVVWVIPQLPLPEALSHGCCITALIEQLSRRLWMMESCGKWARWKPVLEMLYLLRGKRSLVLGDDNFGVFGSRAAFMSETEAVRQWKILSGGVTVGYQQRPLMDGNGMIYLNTIYYLPTLLASASPLFPHAPFDPADPHTKRHQWTYPDYTSMVAFELFRWLLCGRHINRIRSWWPYCRASAEYLRLGKLLAAPLSDAAQWGATVFDEKKESGWHCQLVVFGSEAMGEGHMAVIRLTEHWPIDWGSGRHVDISTTEPSPHAQTRTVVMRVLGDQLGGKVWRQENEGR
ncbi:unnamed protein product [Vitrella brassicaformis CCMP3155]|uniref:Uncharacterized protein n=1 Tax=Vitrella brassicaformis (strain CCMP3155) TaxID=1169540 RepID=A0A0G4FPW9_VITBC|nr:unnamed protein product [Vitrella brassicaformis CCMP3155]|eukprot:CEM16515.1 unnamed protein product [Vitrella brassicaformis CCMP3155]